MLLLCSGRCAVTSRTAALPTSLSAATAPAAAGALLLRIGCRRRSSSRPPEARCCSFAPAAAAARRHGWASPEARRLSLLSAPVAAGELRHGCARSSLAAASLHAAPSDGLPYLTSCLQGTSSPGGKLTWRSLGGRLHGHGGVSMVGEDVIGVAVHQTDIIPSKTNQDPRRQIRIKDATDRTAIVTLWGKHAENFEAESLYQQSVDHNMIILFTGMTVSSFSGMISFMSTSVSRWHFNPPISETEILQNSFEGRHYLVEWDGHSGIPIETSETTLSTLGCTDLSEIIAKKFKLQILITQVNEPHNWWFNSCKRCFSGMKMQDGRRKCRRCTSTECTQRYKLSVDAIDTELPSKDKPVTGRFMLYGDDAAAIIGKDIALLLAQAKGKQNFVPPAITSTVGKKCIVTAVVRDETYDAEEEGLIMFEVKKAEMVDQSSAVQVSVSQDTLSTEDQVADTTNPPTVHHDPTSTPMKSILDETGTDEESSFDTDGKKRKAKTSTSNKPEKKSNNTDKRNRSIRQITFDSEE